MSRQEAKQNKKHTIEKNKTPIVIAIVAICLLFGLFGCQATLEKFGLIPAKDPLIGVFVTRDSLHMMDNMKLEKGRLYARLVSKQLLDEDDNSVDTEEYVFDGEGIAYFAATMPATDNRETFLAQNGDEAIGDGHMSVSFGDGLEAIELKGTIYVSPLPGDFTHFVNPVYQSADGRVYARAGTGSGHRVLGDENEGVTITQSLNESTSMKDMNGRRMKEMSVHLSLSIMWWPHQVVVNQMDGEHKLLHREVFVVGEVPTSFTPLPATEYLVVETNKHDSKGKAVVTRVLIGQNDQVFDSFYCREDRICMKQTTSVAWGDNH